MSTDVAQTILAQLGGKRFLTMTGARTLIGHANALSFNLPTQAGFVKDGINYVKVTLTWRDTYTMELCSVRRGTYQIVQVLEDVYAEDLQTCFTRETGLATRL